jgi:hypothetical protein
VGILTEEDLFWVASVWEWGDSEEPPLTEFRKWFPLGLPYDDQHRRWTNELRERAGIKERV